MTVGIENPQERPQDAHNTASMVLSGIPDYSGGGRAETFFRGLDEQDREVVSWYLQQGIGPYQIQSYVYSLVKGYAVVDPDRKASEVMESAHVELRRINRLLDIFLSDGDYFPYIETCNVSARDEEGNYQGCIEVKGWTRLGTSGEGLFSLQSLKTTLRNRRVGEYIERAHGFINDPSSAPRSFNQDEMLRQIRESIADLDSLY